MTMRFVLGLAAVALAAACSPSTAPADSTAAPAEEAAQKRMPLPDCATVEAVDAGAAGWAHVDCRLQSSDSAGLAFEARYSQPVEGQQTTVTVQVVAPGDATLQTIEEKMDNTFGAPELQDIDGDGRDELLIPLVTGNVNTTWAVWRATDASIEYRRLEELSGVSIDHTGDGYIVTSARSSANSWVASYWRFDGEDLEPLVDVTVTAEGDADGNVTSETCAVEDTGGLADLGLDAAAAEAKFCGDPVVEQIFQ